MSCKGILWKQHSSCSNFEFEVTTRPLSVLFQLQAGSTNEHRSRFVENQPSRPTSTVCSDNNLSFPNTTKIRLNSSSAGFDMVRLSLELPVTKSQPVLELRLVYWVEHCYQCWSRGSLSQNSMKSWLPNFNLKSQNSNRMLYFDKSKYGLWYEWKHCF